MQRKSQASMEFLMTYGWAFLVAIVVIAALAYFGLLSPDRYLPEKCELDTVDLHCASFASNGTDLVLHIQNNMGKPLRGFNITSTLIRNGSTGSKSSYNVNYSYYILTNGNQVHYTGKGKVYVQQMQGAITGNVVIDPNSPMTCLPHNATLAIRKTEKFSCEYFTGFEVGENCTSNDECKSGLCGRHTTNPTRCFGTGDVANGESCIGGHEDNNCQSGFCVDSTGGEDLHCSDGLVGSPCYYHQDCLSGYCDKLNWVCKADGAIGTGCEYGADCDNDICGSNGLCGGAHGDTCALDSECQSNICTGGTGCGGEAGDGCDDNSDCLSPHQCNGKCGIANGDPCNDPSECQSLTCDNGYCGLQDSSSCSNYFECASNVCGGNPKLCRQVGGNYYGSTCTVGSDCTTGYCDRSGLYIQGPSYDGYRCSTGVTGVDGCGDGDDCEDGYCAATSTGPLQGMCSKGEIGNSCLNWNVGVGEQCQSNICATNNLCGGLQFDGTCYSGADCQTGYCGYDNLCSLGASGDSAVSPSECQPGLHYTFNDNMCSDGSFESPCDEGDSSCNSPYSCSIGGNRKMFTGRFSNYCT